MVKKNKSKKYYFTVEDLSKISYSLNKYPEFVFKANRGINRHHSPKMNWLLVWKMEERQMSTAELAKEVNVPKHVIVKMINSRPTDFINTITELTCKALKCNPQDIGYGLKFMTIKSPFKVDVMSLHKIVDIMQASFHECQNTMRNLSYNIRRVQESIINEE